MKNYLFLCGTPRSGTTALMHLLNTHSQIVLGIERYKFLYSKPKNLTLALFEKKRFFNFKDQDTNISPNGPTELLYENALVKFDTAKYIGDKTPKIFKRYNQINKIYEGTKFIFIVRDIYSVASSWNVRAQNDADQGWDKDKDYKKAVESWNESLTKTKDAIDNKIDVCIIHYNSFFAASDLNQNNNLSKLMSFLDLPITPSVANKYLNSCKTYQRLINKDLMIKEGQTEFIQAHANLDLYNELIKKA
ncbi:MAG: sulfotransferase [Cytophagales bacterium]|nr:sulfotransferase [Cytophagales bacterium]